MASALALPAAAGPVAGLVGRNGRYVGYSVRETAGAAAVIRLWSGFFVPASGFAGLLEEIAIPASGSLSTSFGSGPLDGEQYVKGIYVELVSGTMPQGLVRITGPHS